MVGFYDRLNGTAQRLIKLRGKSARLITNINAGTEDDPNQVPIERDCFIVEVDNSFSQRDSETITENDRFGLISTEVSSPPSFDDELVIDGLDFYIKELKPLSPGGVDLLYEFKASR